MRYSISGGIYGVPFKIVFHGPAGDRELLQYEGRQAHTRIKSTLPEKRAALIEEIYNGIPHNPEAR